MSRQLSRKHLLPVGWSGGWRPGPGRSRVRQARGRIRQRRLPGRAVPRHPPGGDHKPAAEVPAVRLARRAGDRAGRPARRAARADRHRRRPHGREGARRCAVRSRPADDHLRPRREPVRLALRPRLAASGRARRHAPLPGRPAPARAERRRYRRAVLLGQPRGGRAGAGRDRGRVRRGGDLRWSQFGFVRDPLPGEKGGTPRNIVGFKDGTNNLHGSTTRPRCAPTCG